MTHFEEHIYAFVKNGIVENACVFADHDDELATLLAKNSGADEAIDCCANGAPSIGGTWDGVEFRPIKPYGSWAWDKVTASWLAPTPYPEDDKSYFWDEEAIAWVEIPAE